MRRKQRKGMSPFLAGLLTLVVLGIGSYLGFTKSIPFRHHYTLQAVFPSANNIRPGSPVRIAGVNVGKVTKVGHFEEGKQAALVTMRIDKKGLPIHDDATMKIRPRIFLEGNFFIDVSPGSPQAPVVHDGDRIPINQTSDPVQLDQVLDALQAPTRADLQALLRELSRGLRGKGATGYNASIPYWKPAYRDSAIVADALQGSQPHDLSRFVDKAGQTAAAIDRNREQLKSLVTDFDTTAGAFAASNEQLSAAVAELPRTLHAGMPALDALNRPLPGLAGESRSGDANGQWFRVMLTTPKYAYPSGTDKFFLTGNPLQGVNPPTPKNHARPPLRPDVPCETQQPPNLAAPSGSATNPALTSNTP